MIQQFTKYIFNVNKISWWEEGWRGIKVEIQKTAVKINAHFIKKKYCPENPIQLSRYLLFWEKNSSVVIFKIENILISPTFRIFLSGNPILSLHRKGINIIAVVFRFSRKFPTASTEARATNYRRHPLLFFFSGKLLFAHDFNIFTAVSRPSRHGQHFFLLLNRHRRFVISYSLGDVRVLLGFHCPETTNAYLSCYYVE